MEFTHLITLIKKKKKFMNFWYIRERPSDIGIVRFLNIKKDLTKSHLEKCLYSR